MTRKVIAVLFLLVYFGSVVGSTAERTQDWIAEHRIIRNDGIRNHLHSATENRRLPRQPQTKLLEDGLALPSLFATTYLSHCETGLDQFLVLLADEQTVRFIPSRAPPAQNS